MIKAEDIRMYFKSLRVIFLALLVGQLLFMLLAGFVHISKDGFEPMKEQNMLFVVLTAVFTIGGLMASNFIYKLKLNATKLKEDLNEKLMELRSALILRWALLEGPCFFAIIGFLIAGNLLLSGFAALLILNFITLRPDVEKLISEMELNATDSEFVRKSLEK